jgi:hypothetical protein
MKCAVAFFLLVAACGGGVVLGDSPTPAAPKPGSMSRPPASSSLLEDLVRMTRTGSSEAAVLAYAKAHRMELPPELSDAALLWLRDSGVRDSVVRYMSAIDVRPSRETFPEGVTEASAASDAVRRRGAHYFERGDEGGEGGGGGRSDVDGDSEAYARGSGYSDDDFGADADYGDSSYSDPYPYASFGYPYSAYSAFPAEFFVGRGRSFRRFPHRDRRVGSHRGDMSDRGGLHDAWRERGPRGGRAGFRPVGPRGPGRSSLERARGNFGPGPRGPRARTVGPRGFGPSGPGRGVAGFRGTRGAMGGAVGGGGGGGHTGSGHPTGRVGR